jgi:serine protease DegS
MDWRRIGNAAIFLAGTVVGGLALAFVVVLARPDLLRPAAPMAAAPAAAGPAAAAPAAVTATSPASTAGAAAAPAVAASPGSGTDPALLSYAGAVRRAAPAVVNVYTERRVTEQVAPSALDQLFGDFWPRYRQRVQRALGSGVIVDASGHIITNHHVVENADTIMVQVADGREARAEVVGRDPDTDLAVLSIKLKHLPVMTLGRSDQLQVGDPVLAIGNPFGLSQTVTHGIVSATGRGQLGVATFENFIQTDAAINFGNSGGALVNAQGELVGINTAMLGKDSTVAVEGIGFAIPVNLARGVMEEILDHGHVIRGWIGIVPEDLDDAQAQQLGLARGGVVVANLYVNSPAYAAGMRQGDIVLQIDGKPVRNAQDTLVQIAAKKPGSKLRVQLLRGHATQDMTLQVGEKPQAPTRT